MLARTFTLATAVVLCLPSAVPAYAQARSGDDAHRVVAVREATMKPGASAQEFERYFAEVYARNVTSRLPGTKVYLLRGERGKRLGAYLVIFEFDSLARRNEYFPQPDVQSEKARELLKDLPPSELSKYIDTDGTYTDYVMLAP